MYTILIWFLLLVAACMVGFDFRTFRSKSYVFSLITFCLLGWIEFVNLLGGTIPAWSFPDNQVIGITFMRVTIEDILFCPIFATIFYWIFKKTQTVFIMRCFNATDKAIYLLFSFVFILVMYFLFTDFANYMAFRMFVGLLCLFYTWNKSSFRHRTMMIMVIYLTGFVLDLIFINLNAWYYGVMSPIYCGNTVRLIEAVFPVEIFFYYLSGAIVIYEIIMAWTIYFSESQRMHYGFRKK